MHESYYACMTVLLHHAVSVPKYSVMLHIAKVDIAVTIATTNNMHATYMSTLTTLHAWMLKHMQHVACR